MLAKMDGGTTRGRGIDHLTRVGCSLVDDGNGSLVENGHGGHRRQDAANMRTGHGMARDQIVLAYDLGGRTRTGLGRGMFMDKMKATIPDKGVVDKVGRVAIRR